MTPPMTDNAMPPPFRVGSVLRRSFSILFRNIVPFGLLAMLLTLPFFVLNFFSGSIYAAFFKGDIHVDRKLLAVVGYPLQFFGGLLWALVMAALCYGTFQSLAGHRMSIATCFEGHAS